MRPSNTQQRRAQIVHALATVMAKQGYDGASISDIATQAGLTPGLVHYHFHNKLEILLALLQDLVQRHDARLTQRLEQAGDAPLAQLEAFIDFHLGVGADADPDTLACWILLGGEALRQEAVRTAFAGALEVNRQRLQGILERGMTQGAVERVEPLAAASALIASIQGYFVVAAAAPALIPRGTAAASVKRMAAGLIGSSQESQTT